MRGGFVPSELVERTDESICGEHFPCLPTSSDLVTLKWSHPCTAITVPIVSVKEAPNMTVHRSARRSVPSSKSSQFPPAFTWPIPTGTLWDTLRAHYFSLSSPRMDGASAGMRYVLIVMEVVSDWRPSALRDSDSRNAASSISDSGTIWRRHKGFQQWPSNWISENKTIRATLTNVFSLLPPSLARWQFANLICPITTFAFRFCDFE